MPGEPTDPPLRPRVIFIRGITQRSGTNYLRDLLITHEQCDRAPQSAREDFALDDAHHLDRYVAAISRRWPTEWGASLPRVRAEIMREMGDGLVRTLIANPARPSPVTVAKTPSVRGLPYFFELFPDDPLVLLVRDGRSVVESLTTSFSQNFDRAARDWAAAADIIVRFQRDHAATHGQRWILLRYEDVLTDMDTALRQVAAIAGLDVAGYDRQAAETLPVRGSSSFARTDDGKVSWRRVSKDESFKPLERAADWDDERHRRFNWIAGEQMTQLGYSLEHPPANPVVSRIRYQPRDVAYAAESTARRLRRRWLGA